MSGALKVRVDEDTWAISGGQGPTGPEGPEGAASTVPGPQGEKGDTGDTGGQGIQGIQGIPGVKGDKGDPGNTGSPGVGVPTGGTANQALTKVDATNYNTQWTTPVTMADVNAAIAAATAPANMLYDVVPVANRWVTPGGAETTVAINQGYPVFMPVRCPPCSINSLGFYLTTTTPANVRLGIYKTHPTLVQPYEKFLDAGLVATSSTAGFKSASFTSVAWPGGLMWLAINANDGNGTVTACTGFGEPWVMFDVAQVPISLGYRQWTYLMGAVVFPTNLPATLGLSGGGNPKIAFKTA